MQKLEDIFENIDEAFERNPQPDEFKVVLPDAISLNGQDLSADLARRRLDGKMQYYKMGFLESEEHEDGEERIYRPLMQGSRDDLFVHPFSKQKK